MKTPSTHIKRKAFRMLLLIGALFVMHFTVFPTLYAENQKIYSEYQIMRDHQVPILVSSPRAKKQIGDEPHWTTKPQNKGHKKSMIIIAKGQGNKPVTDKNGMTKDGVAVMQFFLIILGLTTIWLFSIALGEAIEEFLDWNNGINMRS